MQIDPRPTNLLRFRVVSAVSASFCVHPLVEISMSLDEDFPLGDGTADVEAVVTCPYCGEPGMLTLDPGSGDAQDYVEDCPVCCQPWQVFVRYSADGAATVRLDRL